MSSKTRDSIIDYIEEMDLVINRLTNRFRWLFKKYTSNDVTGAQLGIMQCLRSEGSCNTSYLAEELGVTMSAITAMVNRLYKHGFVLRERREQDRRQVWISITPQGLHFLNIAEQSRYYLLSKYLSQLNEEERTEFLKTLKKLLKAVEKDNH